LFTPPASATLEMRDADDASGSLNDNANDLSRDALRERSGRPVTYGNAR
jgi:hypothetical protein